MFIYLCITNICGRVKYHNIDNMVHKAQHLPTLVLLKSSRLGAMRNICIVEFNLW